MKRIVVILLALVLLVACKTTSNKSNSDASESAQPSIASSQSASLYSSDFKIKSTPDSSAFSEIGYNAAHEVLMVRFRDSGKAYLYYDFSESMYREFTAADSLGSYYNKSIKGSYTCEKVDW